MGSYEKILNQVVVRFAIQAMFWRMDLTGTRQRQLNRTSQSHYGLSWQSGRWVLAKSTEIIRKTILACAGRSSSTGDQGIYDVTLRQRTTEEEFRVFRILIFQSCILYMITYLLYRFAVFLYHPCK